MLTPFPAPTSPPSARADDRAWYFNPGMAAGRRRPRCATTGSCYGYPRREPVAISATEKGSPTELSSETGLAVASGTRAPHQSPSITFFSADNIAAQLSRECAASSSLALLSWLSDTWVPSPRASITYVRVW